MFAFKQASGMGPVFTRPDLGGAIRLGGTLGEQAVQLAGWVCEGMGISRGPGPCLPELQMNHVDGPMLTTRFGEPYWLTWWERIKLALGKTDPIRLEQDFYLRRYRHQLAIKKV